MKNVKKSIIVVERYDIMSTIAQTRTLQVEFDNWKWRKATVSDLHEKAELYRVEFHVRKPQIIVQPTSQNDPTIKTIGEVTFHCLSSRIDIVLNGRDIELSSRGFWKDGYTYASPALDGARMTWQSRCRGGYFDLVCLNEAAMAVARAVLALGSVKKVATIEIMGGEAMIEGRGMDEMVLTGLAILQQRLTTYSASVAA